MAQAATKPNRTPIFVALIIVVIIGVLIAIFVAGNGSPTPSSTKVVDASTVSSMLSGIPQQGTALGSPTAPVTLVGYEDLKCPICQKYNLSVLPGLISTYVKTGKLRMVYVPQTFVGDTSAPGDSKRAASFALAAGNQNKFWDFTELFYHNQQDETTAYVTDDFLKKLSANISGFDAPKALSDRNAPTISQALTQAQTSFTQLGFTGTPSFQLGKTGGTLTTLNAPNLTASEFTGPIDKLLATP